MKTPELQQTPSGGSDHRLVRRLRNFWRQLDTHQRKRESATLILEAAEEIERLNNACNRWSEVETLHPLMHCQKCGELRGMDHACDSPLNSVIK